MKNKAWIPLHEEHGYLDFGEGGRLLTEASPVFLVSENKRVRLNFKKVDVGLNSGEFYSFNQSYFFWPHPQTSGQVEQWINQGCLYGWWLNTENYETYSECIPFAPWKKSYIVLPTLKGMFLVNRNYIGENPKDSGGYLYVEGKYKKIIKGLINDAKLSPNGCKLAIAHKLGNYSNKKQKMTLKVVNICQEKEVHND
jgi:hypothetical protein